MGGGRRLSPTFDEWGIEEEEEDLASGGRSELGRRAAPLPYRSSVIPAGWRKTEILYLLSLDTDGLEMMRRDEQSCCYNGIERTARG